MPEDALKLPIPQRPAIFLLLPIMDPSSLLSPQQEPDEDEQQQPDEDVPDATDKAKSRVGSRPVEYRANALTNYGAAMYLFVVEQA